MKDNIGTNRHSGNMLDPIRRRIARKEVKALAIHTLDTLQPMCLHWGLVGGLVLGHNIVDGIDVICLPLPDARHRIGAALSTIGDVIKGNVFGKYIALISADGVRINVYMPDRKDFFRIYILRTSSPRYRNIIFNRLNHMGWVSTEAGWRLVEQCYQRHDGKYIPKPDAEEMPFFGSEKEFYDFIGLPFRSVGYRD